MKRIVVAATVFAVMVVRVAVGSALGLDCNGRLIDIGASPWEVRERCGEPANIESVTKDLPQLVYDPFRQYYVQTLVSIQQSIWTYNFGPTRLIYFLTFQDGKLIDIKTGNYGQ